MYSLTLKYSLCVALAAAVQNAPAIAAEAPVRIDPANVSYQLPADIKWQDDNGGRNQSAMLVGDANKPGLYIKLLKFRPHSMSRPHFHQNDRYIMVLSGVWWVGTSSKFDPDNTVAMPAGTFVTHFGKKIHFDGAKDIECVLEVVGMGPVITTPAEQK